MVDQSAARELLTAAPERAAATAEILGAYYKQLVAQGIPPVTVHSLVTSAGRLLLDEHGLTVSTTPA